MTINQKIRAALGVIAVICGIMQQGPNKDSIENAAWFIVVMIGFFVLITAIIVKIEAIFAGNENKIENKIEKNRMVTVWIFYFIAAACCIAALSYQSELSSIGKIYVGKDYSYSISGVAAHQQINTCWLGAIISFVIAIILHIRVKLLSSKISKSANTPEVPQFVICPKCIEPLRGKDNQTMICTTCQSPLENLKGYQDRHPELKSSGKDSSTLENNV